MLFIDNILILLCIINY